MAAKDCVGPQCSEQIKYLDNYTIGLTDWGLEQDELKFDVGKTYHGTGGELEGGIVKPVSAEDGGRERFGKGAYGLTTTNNPDSIYQAISIARDKAVEQGRLFGAVYPVKTMSDNAESFIRNDMTTLGKDQQYVRDTKGLQVTGPAVAFPLNPNAVMASRQFANAKAKRDKWLSENDTPENWI